MARKKAAAPLELPEVQGADHNGVRQLIQLTMQSVGAVNAKDGSLLWKVPFPGKTAVIPTPIFSDGHVFVSAGYGVGAKLIKIGEGNKAEDLNPEMNPSMVNHHGGVILVDGKIYGHSDKGGWTCQDFMTGETLWQYNVGSGVHSSPTTFMVDGKQYVAILVGPGGGSLWPLVYGDWFKTHTQGGGMYVFGLHK